MNRHCPIKSTVALVLFTANLTLLNPVNAHTSDLKIHINSDTHELLETPHDDKRANNQEEKTEATRQLLSIEASLVEGGGFIVTPSESILPHLSIHIDDNGHMKTICR